MIKKQPMNKSPTPSLRDKNVLSPKELCALVQRYRRKIKISDGIHVRQGKKGVMTNRE